MKFPTLIVNLKNYAQGSGVNALNFFRFAEELLDGVGIYIAPPILDTLLYVDEFRDILMSQSVDVVGYGSSTGHVPLMRLIESGVRYSLINHSEFKLPHNRIFEIWSEASRHGFELVVCVDSIDELNSLLDLGVSPSAYAIEPPELIGTGRSVSKYRPELIVEAVTIGKEYGIPILCGAGISSREDVAVAMELGVEGVLVASAIVKADDPYSVMKEFIGSMI
jgi:triosephosphate isomerase